MEIKLDKLKNIISCVCTLGLYVYKLGLCVLLLYMVLSNRNKTITELKVGDLAVFFFVMVLIVYYSLEEMHAKIDKKIDKKDKALHIEITNIRNVLNDRRKSN